MLVGVENHLQERNDHGKHHPHINHLDIGSGGQTLGDAKKTEEEKVKARIRKLYCYLQRCLD